MRPKKQANNPPPNGYPYLLYQVKVGKDWRYATGATEEQALRKVNSKKGKIEPASVNSMIHSIGHEKTHYFLSRFGKKWVCKEGLVFYNDHDDYGRRP